MSRPVRNEFTDAVAAMDHSIARIDMPPADRCELRRTLSRVMDLFEDLAVQSLPPAREPATVLAFRPRPHLEIVA